jgi:2-keto-4-pentenoate hydratase/2-oxohepta-3-ene-1,7-dioic acid hydratase in catechol pathway
MRLVRFRFQKETSYGVLNGDEINSLAGPPFSKLEYTGKVVPLSEAELLAPCTPSKIVAVGLNYRDHAGEIGMALPEEPLLFLKPSTAVAGPGEPVIYPPGVSRLDYEAELAVIIGKRAKNVGLKDASAHISGYSCFNDVTARDLQQKDVQFTRSKSFDSFAPLGPWIDTDLDPSDLKIAAYLNGQKVQSSSTRQLVFSVPELVCFISGVMTLNPGDVIATGTPSGIGPMQRGDEIAVEIEGIGRLNNIVM